MVSPYIGQPYSKGRCWEVVRHLLQAGLGLNLDSEPEKAAHAFSEVWYYADPEPVLSIIHPWDLVILAGGNRISRHVSLALDATAFVHANKRVGVCIEPLLRWEGRIIQVARLRSLA
jgi:hypothetical protein